MGLVCGYLALLCDRSRSQSQGHCEIVLECCELFQELMLPGSTFETVWVEDVCNRVVNKTNL